MAEPTFQPLWPRPPHRHSSPRTLACMLLPARTLFHVLPFAEMPAHLLSARVLPGGNFSAAPLLGGPLLVLYHAASTDCVPGTQCIGFQGAIPCCSHVFCVVTFARWCGPTGQRPPLPRPCRCIVCFVILTLQQLNGWDKSLHHGSRVKMRAGHEQGSHKGRPHSRTSYAKQVSDWNRKGACIVS